MSTEKTWAKLTIVDADDKEFAWIACDVRHAYGKVPASTATAGLTLTEDQARTLAKRILATLGDIESEDDEDEI